MKLFFTFTFCIAAIKASNYHWFTMSADKVTLVNSTWNEVKENEVEILYGVFKDYPNIQARFPKFTDKDLNMIKNTVDFTIQATRTASFLNTYIILLGKDSTQPAIKQMLNTMGENHKKRGITKENFEFFKISFLKYLKLNSNFSDDAAHAWNEAFEKLYFVIFKNLDGFSVE